MRHLLLLLITLVYLNTTGSVFGQVPNSISFQGLLERSDGEPLDSAGVEILFKLYGDGGEVWSETQTVDVVDGVFDVSLGVVSPLDTVRFGRPFSLGITLVGEGVEFSPRTNLEPSAYALGIRGMSAFHVAGEFASLGAESISIVGGHSSNSIDEDVLGGTISGGGVLLSSIEVGNSVQADFGTVGGGFANAVSGDAGTIGGGSSNIASGSSSTVAGGGNNNASFTNTTVGGGSGNDATSTGATVGGGSGNRASDIYSTVPGGEENLAGGDHSFAAGYRAQALHNGTFVWNDRSTISGDDSLLSTAPNQFLIRAAGGVGIGTNSPDEQLHILEAGGSTGIKLGGDGTPGPNGIVFDDDAAGSGVQLFWRSSANQLILERTSQGTGVNGSDAFWYDRDTDHFMFDGTIGVGPGEPRAAITVRGPDNPHSGPVLFFTGESSDQVESGRIRFVEGFAAGNYRGAYIRYDGSGNTGNRLHIGVHDASDSLSTNDEDIITVERVGGDVGIRNINPSFPLQVGTDSTNGNGAHVTDGGVWTNGSSREFKTKFTPVDQQEILDRLASIPIEEWQYKNSDEGRHIGPVAEDFYHAFGLGRDNQYIGTVDADGVSMAAIQGLYQLVTAQQATLDALQTTVIAQQTEIERLRTLVEGE